MSATITTRLILNGEPLWGKANVVSDADAVAQIILTRLKMFKGEWWQDLNDGLPLWQELLGVGGANNTKATSVVIQNRVLGTPFVTGMTQVSSTFDPNARKSSFSAVVQTPFGAIKLTNSPTVNSGALPQ